METTTLKDEFIEEVISKVFKNSNSMRKYFISSVSDVFKSEDGFLIEFEKPRIETSFCFSYDEHIDGSYEDAAKMCNVQKDYFVEYNLKSHKRRLENLMNSDKFYFVKNYEQTEKVVIWVTEEYKLNHPTLTYLDCSDADKIKLIEMQEKEIEKFQKRLETYFKKYGTSKLKTWTYSCWD